MDSLFGVREFYEFEVDNDGMLYLWYFGMIVAAIQDGVILTTRMGFPISLVEYLLLQPRPETTQWN